MISELAITVAKPAIHRGMSSFMVFPSINPYTELPAISVLNMLWYANDKIPVGALSNTQPKRYTSII